MKEYAALIILAIIFALLGWLYVSLICQSKRYNKKLKRLKKIKILSKRIRRNRVWY